MHEPKIETTLDGLPAARAGSTIYAMVPGADGHFRIVSKYGDANISQLTRSDFYGISDKVEDLEGFKAYVADYLAHLAQVKELGRFEMASKTRTPWGPSQGATVYVENGIYFHSTAGHGGFKVYAKLNRDIPEAYRNADGWYEEDCEYAKVIASLPLFFTDREVKMADQSLRNWFPDEYEAVTGKVIPEGTSFKKDERLFKERHAEDWIVIAATATDDGMVHCYATVGGRRNEWDAKDEVEEAEFMVPGSEYSKRSVHGFVIDPARHERIGAPAAPGM